MITLGETLSFDAILNAQNFMSSINQMVQGMSRVEQSGSSVSSGLAASMSGQQGKFASVGRELGSTLTQSMGSQFGAAGNVASSLAGALGPVGIAAGVAGGALLAAGSASVNLARAWETSMAGVSKTTGLTGADLATLSGELQNMATTTPLAASELANIAAVAGSLGVAKENIAGFTQAAAMMGVGFDMPADQAATAAAKILNSFSKPIDSSNMMALGNVVNMIGDSMAATEPEMLDFINRASYLGTTMGQSIPQIAALGGVLISAGLSSETASTGIKSLLNMGLSEKTEGKGAFAWADLMGVSVDQLKEKVGSDFNNTLAETADKIAQIEDPVKRFEMAVALAGTEGAPALLKLAGSAETLKQKLADADSEWTNGTSLMKTFEAQSSTLDSQWQIFTNTLGKAGTELGTVMLPVLTDVVKMMTGLVTSATSAGEALGSMWGGIQEGMTGTDKGILDFFGYSGTSNKTADQMAYEASQAATSYTDEWGNVFEGDAMKGKLVDPVAEALKGTVEASGDIGVEAAKAFADAQESYIKSHSSGGYSLDLMKMMAGQDSSDESDYFSRQFEYLGKQFKLDMTNTEQGLWNDVWTIGDAKTSTTGLAQKSYDPLVAFELATGLPAPEEGTAAYYRLMGNAIKAEQVELQAALDVDKIELFTFEDFDIEKISKNIAPMKDAFGNLLTGDWAGMSLKGVLESYVNMASEGGKDSAIEFAEMFASGMSLQDWETLPQMQEAFEAISKATPWEADRLSDQFQQYKDLLWSQITDVGDFAKIQFTTLGESIGSSLKDGIVNQSDLDLYAAMEPMLLEIKARAPEAFGEAGLSSILKFVEMAQNDASASELLAYFSTLGQEAGTGFTGALGEKISQGYKDATDALGSNKIFEMLFSGSEADNLKANTWIQKYVGDKDVWFDKHAKAYLNSNKEMLESGLRLEEGSLEQIRNLWTNNADFFTEDMNARMTVADQIIKQHFGSWGEFAKEADQATQLELMDYLIGESDKSTKATERQSVGYDNLAKSIEGCADCATSEFGDWQEAQDKLFKGFYLGEGGDKYSDYVTGQVEAIAATQRAVQNAGGRVLGKDYTGQRESGIPVNLDTKEAFGQVESVKSAIEGVSSSIGSMKMTLDASAATSAVENVNSQITTLNNSLSSAKTLTINTASALAAIAAIDAAASKPVTKIVNIQEVGGGGGGGGGSSGFPSVSAGAFTPGGGGTQGGISWLPTYAEGGFIAAPELAIVGDSPGGEWMIPNNKMQDLVNGVLGGASPTSASLSLFADTTQGDEEVSAWRDSLERKPIKVRIEADIIVNSESVREMIIEAIEAAVKGVRR